MQQRHEPKPLADRWPGRGASPKVSIRYLSTREGIIRIKHGGMGSPTSLFIGGIGEGIQAWNATLPLAAEVTHVMAFDRLGLGRSGPAKRPRDARTIAEEMHELLKALHEREPVVFVAHSAGAFYVRMFSRLWPERVAGLVFVEPSHEEWLLELKEQDAKAWLRHMEWRHSQHPPGRKRELDAWAETVEQMREIGLGLPRVPVTIISATAGNAAATDVLFRLHRHWAESIPGVRHVVTDAGGHHIQREAPEIIASALDGMVGELRAGRWT